MGPNSARGSPPEQQDAIAVDADVVQSANHLSQRWIDAAGVLISIADGVAVSQAAARASRLALTYMHESFLAWPDWLADGLIAGRHVRAAQVRLASALSGSPRTCGASTTIVSAQIDANRLAVLNVGDSRAYLRAANAVVTQLSHDHSQHESLVSEPGFKEGVEYASIYGALSDCLVADPEESDFSVHRATAEVSAGDMIILCSDGVWEGLGDSRLRALIQQSSSPLGLVKRIRTEVRGAGAPDNFSVVAARLARHDSDGVQP